MSYQVLARKWRPKSFREMVGQEHVLQALINALDHDRLHHAYLFTGTRGVGKTTIARILAKCLNCEQGVSSEPCGQCSSCLEIAEGRSVDLWEIDAASRTKVEDTRDLLDNVQYLPTHSRYKVYLIDEVHMLSNSSFNALLKTLEEPPPHVKFLLATTDPQKLPATVLSRCLQFNLKNMLPEQVVSHLTHVLDQEMVAYDDPALWLLGRAAEGSMRDALSLTDQAIAFGSGKLSEPEVRTMLGSVDLSFIYQLLDLIAAQNTAGALEVVNHMSEHAPDFEGALDELISLIHRVAIAQAVPDAVDNNWGDADKISQLAARLTAEDAQLFYQVAINGKRDIGMANNPRTGFEMLLLRMIAFRPAAVLDESLTPDDLQAAALPAANTVVREVDPEPKKSHDAPTISAPPLARDIKEAVLAPPAVPKVKEAIAAPQITQEVEEAEPEPEPEPALAQATIASLTPKSWSVMLEQLGLVGIVYNIASNCELQSCHGATLQFVLDKNGSSLFNDGHVGKIRMALENFFATKLDVSIVPGELSGETPAMVTARKIAQRQQEAVVAIESDPVLQQLIERFDGELDRTSIVPRET
ncbi:MAG: DNA polymerase III subunit gamma/tau [Halioglobus sp.]